MILQKSDNMFIRSNYNLDLMGTLNPKESPTTGIKSLVSLGWLCSNQPMSMRGL